MYPNVGTLLRIGRGTQRKPNRALHHGGEVSLSVEHLQEVVAEQPVQLGLVVLDVHAAVVLRLVQLVHIARQDHLEIGDEESQETEIDALHVKRGVSTNHQVRFAVAADSVSDQWPDQRQNTEIDYLQRHRKHCPQSEDNKPKLLSLRPSFLCSVRVQNSCIRFPGKKRMGISCTVRGVTKREW